MTSGDTSGARLIGRSGAVAGSSFELGPDSIIGLDSGGQLTVGPGAAAVPLARIFEREGRFFLENRAESGEVRVDGTAVSQPTPLDRMHVLELPDGIELVFTRRPAAPRRDPPPAPETAPPPEPETPPPPPPEPQAPEAPVDPPTAPPVQDPGKTVLDMAAFGELPDLGSGEPEGTSDNREEEGGTASDAGRTVVDMEAFGALPELDAAPSEAEESGGEEPPRESGAEGTTPQEAEAEGVPREAGKDRPSSPPDPGKTILDMAAFGALPEVEESESENRVEESGAKPQVEDSQAEGTTRQAPVQPDPHRFRISTEGSGDGRQSWELKPGENVIGRGTDCHISVHDPERWLSRRHAILHVDAKGVEIEDLKGVNGTFVQGERIERARLEPGQAFLLGPHMEFTLEEQ